MNNKEKAQVIEGIISIVVNAVLFAVKFWAGTITGSIALVADAWHTLSDSLTSVIVVFAAKLTSQKPDKKHPFGHGRWEQICSMFCAFALGIIAYEFFVSSIARLQGRENVVYGTAAIVVTVIGIAVKEALAQYGFYIARKTDNPLVKADAWHSRTDSLGSVIVLIGIIVSRIVPGFWWMDGVLGIICALVILYAAYEIMKEAIAKVLGEEPAQDLIDDINSEVKKLYENNDFKLHHFHLHNYISQQELTLHIYLDKNMTIENGHAISTVIEDMIKEKFNMTATVHVEPLI